MFSMTPPGELIGIVIDPHDPRFGLEAQVRDRNAGRGVRLDFPDGWSDYFRDDWNGNALPQVLCLKKERGLEAALLHLRLPRAQNEMRELFARAESESNPTERQALRQETWELLRYLMTQAA